MTADLFIHAVADIRGKGVEKNTTAFIQFTDQIIHAYINTFAPRKLRAPYINGHDLINAFGLHPSPLFAEILRQVEEEQMSGNIRTRKEAFAFVQKKYKSFATGLDNRSSF